MRATDRGFPDDNPTVHYLWDDLDRLQSITRPGNRVWAFEYDENGQLGSRVDPKGQRVEFGYDELRRLTSARFLTAGQTTERLQQLGYDPEGSLVSIGEQVNGATRNYTRTYDGRRRLERATDCFGNTVRYGYDNANRVTSLRTEGAVAGVNEVRYDYDNQDRISHVKDATNAVLATYQYRPDNQLSSVAYANGMTRAYSYDSANRVTAIENAWAGGGERHEYEYDTASNRKNEKRYLNGQNTRDVNYTYDLWDRLTGARYEDKLGGGVAALSYGYDLVGNRTSETGTRPGGGAVNRTFSHDDLNQITSMADGVDPQKSATFQHDANGNLISETEAGGRVKQFAYDVRDQMTAAWETPSGGSQSLLGSYEYDYQKRRVRKTVGGQALDYVYNGINVLGEAAGGQLVARYDFGADLVRATFDGESGSRWQGHDALGSTTALVGDDGALAARYEYDAWGNTISAQQPALNKVGFTGYWVDDETGLNYAVNRYYDSETGRFTSADPLTERDRRERLRHPQSINLYSYTAGNPVNRVDQDGLAWLRSLLYIDSQGVEHYDYRFLQPGNINDIPQAWAEAGYTEWVPDGTEIPLTRDYNIPGWGLYHKGDEVVLQADGKIRPATRHWGDLNLPVSRRPISSDWFWNGVNNTSNFLNGFADSFLFVGLPGGPNYNFSDDIRWLLGTRVDKSSKAYYAGNIAHHIWWAAFGGASAFEAGAGSSLTQLWPEGVPNIRPLVPAPQNGRLALPPGPQPAGLLNPASPEVLAREAERTMFRGVGNPDLIPKQGPFYVNSAGEAMAARPMPGIGQPPPTFPAHHLFEGEIKTAAGGNLRGTGMHHAPISNPFVMLGETRPPNALGVYEAETVWLYDQTRGLWVQKGIYNHGNFVVRGSTMFPDSWTKAQTLAEIHYAYLNRLAVPNKPMHYEGRGQSGILIHFVIKNDGTIPTVYPIFEP